MPPTLTQKKVEGNHERNGNSHRPQRRSQDGQRSSNGSFPPRLGHISRYHIKKSSTLSSRHLVSGTLR